MPEPTTYVNDEAAKEDKLNRDQYAEAFARLAETCDTPLVVGLYGGWGVGKTTLMELIETKLDTNKARAVWFDPWRHQFDESPALALLQKLVDTFEMQAEAETKKLLAVVAVAFGSTLLKATTGLNLKDLWQFGKRFEEQSFQVREARVQLQKNFKDLITKVRGNQRIVFFIDDLDRCMPAQTLRLLESLKLFLNLEGCVYFLGVDRRALERSIQYHYKGLDLSETSYLDKIIQLPFTIPPIATESMNAFVAPLLSEALKPCQEVLVKGLGDNPRQVKRFINTLTLNHHLAAPLRIRDYDPTVLALLLLVQLRRPELFREISSDPVLLRGLKEGSEETKALREKFLADEKGLKEVLAKVEIPDEDRLEQYIYLTRFARAKEEEEEEIGRQRLSLGKLKAVLVAHQKWLDSSGELGKQADLSGANLAGAVLSGAVLSGAALSGAVVTRANLTGAVLSGAALSGAVVTRANLVKADLRGANLRDANLSDADLRGADLRGANLRDAVLSGANLSGADLRGANLSGVTDLTEKQLASAKTDDKTILPDGSKGPFGRGSGTHRPPRAPAKRSRKARTPRPRRAAAAGAK